MDIKVLGTGCAKCKAVEKTVKEVLAELNIDAEVEDVRDMAKIMEYKVMMTPGLVIDGKVVSSGHVPSKNDVKKMIEEARK
ncbi:MAG: thioredoxin family protein [Dehalococcoidia bacterium]|jgi:small redox-active disulfide protein 2|nr:thioredoxin family protein [Dehalococcoidia bacterium]